MADKTRIIPDWKPQQLVEDYQLDQEFDNIYDGLNNVTSDRVVLDANSRFPVNCLDAATLGGSTLAEIVAGQYPGLQEAQAVVLSDFVYSGGAATKNGTTANQLDVTAIVALFKDPATDKLVYKAAVVPDPAFTTTQATATYYLDFTIAGEFNFATSHPATTYLPIARVTTDSSGNISLVTDLRELTPQLLLGGDSKVDLSNTADMTIDQTVTANAGPVTTLINRLLNLVKGVTGKASAFTAPAITLETTKSRLDGLDTTAAAKVTQVDFNAHKHNGTDSQSIAVIINDGALTAQSSSFTSPDGVTNSYVLYGTVTVPGGNSDFANPKQGLNITSVIWNVTYGYSGSTYDAKLTYQIGAGAETLINEHLGIAYASGGTTYTDTVNISNLYTSLSKGEITFRVYAKLKTGTASGHFTGSITANGKHSLLT